MSNLRMSGRLDMCDGKKSFGDNALAVKFSSKMNRSNDTAKTHAYKCLSCSYWHIGNSRKMMEKRPSRHFMKGQIYNGEGE